MTEWCVTVEAMREDEKVAEEEVDSFLESGALDRFLDALADHHGAVSGSPVGWSATITIEADTPDEALSLGVSAVGAAARKALMPNLPVVALECVRADVRDARDREAALPDLVGASEVLDMLVVSRQRLQQLRNEGRFPAPMIELKATPLWMRSAIEAYIERWNRKAYRRPPYPAAPWEDEAGRTRHLRLVDDAVQVPEDLIVGPHAEPIMAWVNLEMATRPGIGVGGQPIREVPVRVWNRHFAADGRSLDRSTT